MTNAEREFWENEGEYEAYEEDYAFGETEASLTPPSAASPRESQAYVIPSRPQPGRIHDEVWETLNYCKYSAGAFRHNYYESTLETVRVHSVSVEGNWDEPSCAMRVDSIDRINSIENVGREYTDYPEPDWYAKLDGETFTISWRNRTGESLGIELTGSKNRVVWTCGVNVVDVENQLDSLMEENAILNVYRHVCGHKGARTVQECKSGFANLLLAYLQAHAGECDTPRDADDYAEAFFDYVLQGSLQMYRAYYTPSMVSLVNGAVRAARPTSTGIGLPCRRSCGLPTSAEKTSAWSTSCWTKAAQRRWPSGSYPSRGKSTRHRRATRPRRPCYQTRPIGARRRS